MRSDATYARPFDRGPDVQPIHDLDAWTIIGGPTVGSAGVVMGPDADPGRLRDDPSDCLPGDFDIDHWTFRLKSPECVPWEGRVDRVRV